MNSYKTKYGWLPDLPDHRDFTYNAPSHVIKKLPAKVDLRNQCPPVYMQGQLNSCTANAIGAAIEFEMMKQKDSNVFTPSRLFIYYNERGLENTIAMDCGAHIRDGMKCVNQIGYCPEEMWPYYIQNVSVRPPYGSYIDAMNNKVMSYHKVQRTLQHLKACLAQGYPFIFGFTIYESFESNETAKTGIVNMPKPNEKCNGGHAVLAVGYDDKLKRFIVRNSWSDRWGMQGYFTMPYDYLLNENLSKDFWTIRLVKDKD